jgi:hypothetical protein
MAVIKAIPEDFKTFARLMRAGSIRRREFRFEGTQNEYYLKEMYK